MATTVREADIEVVAESERIDRLLEPFRAALGDDYAAYRGHVYRVVTYAMHFLGGDESERALIETAFVYHDVGLWTEHELAYLEPSEARAVADNEAQGWGLDGEALRAIIHWHHKVTRYRGPHERVVEAARRADWIDATGGWRRMGLSWSQVAAVESAIPNYGFGGVLQRLAGVLGGNRVAGNLRVLRRVFKF
ncbi:MAG: phosphohydrolase [Planctomycetota bacterium]